MKIIQMINGFMAFVDDSDFERVNQHVWHAVKDHYTYYAHATIQGKNVSMHRFILGTSPGVQVDHKDRNGLDNQRYNLREATHSQNQHNRRAQNRSYAKHSRHKGLTWCESHGAWQVRIMVDRKRRFIGYFEDETDAARAYNDAAIRLCGEFAGLNTV